MSKNAILKGNYIKVPTSERFKSRASDKSPKTKSRTILSSGNIYPFSSKKLTDFAF
jgi:hypothetical protein